MSLSSLIVGILLGAVIAIGLNWLLAKNQLAQLKLELNQLAQVALKNNNEQFLALANERLAQVERGLTLPAPDGGDSSASQALSTPDMFSAIEHEPTPAPRR